MRTFASLVLLLLFIGLSACGFKLKQDWTLNNTNNTIKLAAVSAQKPMNKTLRQYLAARGVAIASSTDTNVPEITVINESLERRLLSLFSSGQVAEYDLIFNVSYTIQFPGEESLVYEYQEIRQYQDDPDRALAKSKERNVIVKKMREKACTAILRRYIGVTSQQTR